MRKYRILELVITRDQTRNALHAPSRSLQESPQEGTAGTEPTQSPSLTPTCKHLINNLRIKKVGGKLGSCSKNKLNRITFH